MHYIELKNLPNDQKKEALMELQSRFGDNRSIANKLGASTIAITNMVRKYVLGEYVGRPKKDKTADIKPITAVEEKPKRKYTKKARIASTAKPEPVQEEPVNISTDEPAPGNLFSINISKTLTGESLQSILAGIGNSLVKDQVYKLDLSIREYSI